jgi:hypothetical protein
MRHIFERFETLMTAAAFAEEGEFDAAREIMKESELRKAVRPSKRKRQRPDSRKELRAE